MPTLMTSTMAIAIHANRNFSFHSAFPCVCRRSECCLAAAVVVAPLHRMYQFTWLARRHQKPFTVMDCSIAWNWSSFVVRIAQWPITTQQTKWPTTKLFCAQFILFASHLSDKMWGCVSLVSPLALKNNSESLLCISSVDSRPTHNKSASL